MDLIKLETALPTLLTALEKLFDDIDTDVKDPAELLNITADVQTINDIKTAIADVKAVVAAA